MKLDRREFLKLVGQVLGALGIDASIGKSEPFYDFLLESPSETLLDDDNIPIGIVKEVKGQTMTVALFRDYQGYGRLTIAK